MVKIVVSEEQAKAIAEAKGSVEIVDSSGNRLGFFARPFTDQDVAVARQRASSDEPRRTTKQVLERLKSLERE